MKKIVIIEDEVLIALSYKVILEKHGYVVNQLYRSGEEFQRKAGELDAKLVIIDIQLAGPDNGLMVARYIRKFSSIPIIFATGNPWKKEKSSITEIENSILLIKPLLKEELLQSVESMIL